MPIVPPLPPRIRAGKLRQYASIEQQQKLSTGDRGQPITAWVALYQNVPMEIIPLQGRLLEIARQLVGTATHQVTLRYHAGVTPEMRVTYQGRHFGIGYVGDGDMRKHYLTLVTTEQQTGAT